MGSPAAHLDHQRQHEMVAVQTVPVITGQQIQYTIDVALLTLSGKSPSEGGCFLANHGVSFRKVEEKLGFQPVILRCPR